MAFRYQLDGKEYFDEFHFWYVNGRHPKKEFIVEVLLPNSVEGRIGPEPTKAYSQKTKEGMRQRSGWYK